jgi:hypothetical protein
MKITIFHGNGAEEKMFQTERDKSIPRAIVESNPKLDSS